MSILDIDTDGGCHGNPGQGGWAAIVYDGPRPTEMSVHETETTNQRMELKAAIEALKHLEHPRRVRLFSDSAYLINGMNQQWFIKMETERMEEFEEEAGREPRPLERVDKAFQVPQRGVEEGQRAFGDRGQRTVRCPGSP